MSEVRPPVGPPRSSNPKPFQRSLAKRDASTLKEPASQKLTVKTQGETVGSSAKDQRSRRERPDETNRRKEKTTSRATIVKDISIVLTNEDPTERLKEFCEQGRYIFHWNWDKFATGVMCELEISYQLDAKSSKGDRRKILAKESRYIPFENGDLVYAQKVVAAILLDRLGLGVPAKVQEDETVSSESPSEDDGVPDDSNVAVTGDDIMENLMKNLATKLNQNLAEAGVDGAFASSVFEAARASVSAPAGPTSSTLKEPASQKSTSATSTRWADIVKDKLGGK